MSSIEKVDSMAAREKRAHRMIEMVGVNDATLSWSARQDPVLKTAMDAGGMFVWARDDRKLSNVTKGTKNYATCSLAVMRQYMFSRRSPVMRNVYEVLREKNPDGTYVASKIYIDCDLKKDECDLFDIRAKAFRDVFPTDMREFLAKYVDPDFLDEHKTPLISLDSSSSKKWSMHYIFGGIMFCNIYHVGAVVRRFRDYVIEKYGNPGTCGTNPYFYTNTQKKMITDGFSDKFIIDLGVYTRNRVFRVMGNCKAGKSSMLIPEYIPRETQHSVTFSLRQLQDSIVQDPVLALKCKIYTMEESDGSEPQSRSVSRIFVGGRGVARLLKRGSPAANAPVVVASNTLVHVGFPVSVAEKLCEIVHTLHPQITLIPQGAKYRPNQMLVILNQSARCLRCLVSDRTHTSPGNYFVFDLVRGRYKQLCFKQTCRSIRESRTETACRSSWSFPPAMDTVMREFLAHSNASLFAPMLPSELASLFAHIACVMPADYVDDVKSDEDDTLTDLDDLLANGLTLEESGGIV